MDTWKNDQILDSISSVYMLALSPILSDNKPVQPFWKEIRVENAWIFLCLLDIVIYAGPERIYLWSLHK